MKVPRETFGVCKDGKETIKSVIHIGNALLKVPELIAPLRQDAQRVLEKGDNNKEAANCGQVGLQRLGVDLNIVFDLLAERLQLFQGVIGVGRSVTGGSSRTGI